MDKEYKTIFVDKFSEKDYTISIRSEDEYIMDVAVVNDYKQENPYITLSTSVTLSDINEIVNTISLQQKDVNMFGPLLIELNSEKK
jgi:hypothetical protein